MASSCSFVAELHPLSEIQLVKLHAWIQKSCKTGDVHLNPDGTMKLVCTRRKASDKRQHQRALRTNLVNWGVTMEDRQSDWLHLIDDKLKQEDAESGKETEEEAPGSPRKLFERNAEYVKLPLPENLLTWPFVAVH